VNALSVASVAQIRASLVLPMAHPRGPGCRPRPQNKILNTHVLEMIISGFLAFGLNKSLKSADDSNIEKYNKILGICGLFSFLSQFLIFPVT
jgi:hypothetical protein